MRKGPSRGQSTAQKLRWEWALLVAVTAAVLAGAALWFAGRPGAANLLWAGATTTPTNRAGCHRDRPARRRTAG
jgi:hypothetical protein